MLYSLYILVRTIWSIPHSTFSRLELWKIIRHNQEESSLALLPSALPLRRPFAPSWVLLLYFSISLLYLNYKTNIYHTFVSLPLLHISAVLPRCVRLLHLSMDRTNLTPILTMSWWDWKLYFVGGVSHDLEVRIVYFVPSYRWKNIRPNYSDVFVKNHHLHL